MIISFLLLFSGSEINSDSRWEKKRVEPDDEATPYEQETLLNNQMNNTWNIIIGLLISGLIGGIDIIIFNVVTEGSQQWYYVWCVWVLVYVCNDVAK